MNKNSDEHVIRDFGEEWKHYHQRNLEFKELNELFYKYFSIFPFEKINKNSKGFDMGCGSGRWAAFIAPKVKQLYCIEPSKIAIEQAKINLKRFNNCAFENSDVMENKLENNSQDFGYSLGVLHHIPDTYLGLKSCINKLKKGAPFLLYLYYRFDNKPTWFKLIWKISNIFRLLISRLPFQLKLYVTILIAILIYFPFSKVSLLLEKIGFQVGNLPLSSYRNTSFYTMKTDALDRFGTRLEHRFTKDEILIMMEDCGLTNIKFSDEFPFWVAVGEKK